MTRSEYLQILLYKLNIKMNATPVFVINMISEVPSNPQLTLESVAVTQNFCDLLGILYNDWTTVSGRPREAGGGRVCQGGPDGLYARGLKRLRLRSAIF